MRRAARDCSGVDAKGVNGTNMAFCVPLGNYSLSNSDVTIPYKSISANVLALHKTFWEWEQVQCLILW